MKTSRFRFLANKWFIIAVVLVLIVAGAVYAKTRSKAPNFEYAAAAIGTVVEQVSVTGTVSPIGEANLAFEKSGVISKIYVSVGDQVNAGDPIAQLDTSEDQAAYDSAAATLADMTRSLTPDELAVQDAALQTAVSDAVNAAHEGYAGAQGAVVNDADDLFANAQSPNPTLKVQASSPSIATSIENERVSISGILTEWSGELASASTSEAGAAQLVSDSIGYLTSVKGFMQDLSSVVNSLTLGNSGVSETELEGQISAMNAALTALNSAIASVTSAQTELATAQSDYDLKLAGNSADSIAAQSAKADQAQVELDQDTLVSPLAGVVTQADPNVGEFIAAGQGGFAVQDDDFKIEAYVPEADIAKVAVGDLASSTLDAYGAYVDFPAKVTAIDPAETVLEGVPTYKVTLEFLTPDSRIRSGMTDNLEILTHQAANVLEIPYRAVTMTATSTTVRLVSADGESYSAVPVTTGLKGSDGTIQILSGLQVGDKVVTYVKS